MPRKSFYHPNICSTVSIDYFYVIYSTTYAFYSKDIVMPVRPVGYEWLKAHYQNKGIFPKRRREQFTELTDDEIARMQVAYRAIYEIV